MDQQSETSGSTFRTSRGWLVVWFGVATMAGVGIGEIWAAKRGWLDGAASEALVVPGTGNLPSETIAPDLARLPGSLQPIKETP